MNCVDFLFSETYDKDKLLILGQREQVSYGDIWSKVEKLSKWLNANYGSNNKVVLSSVNNSFFIIAYFAIMKSGNICIPLNPAIEKDQFIYITDITSSNISFLSRQVKARLGIGENTIDELLLDNIISEDIVDHDVLISIEDNQPAQIIFTSGSTAEPKGVMISHGNIIANTESIIDYLQLASSDIMEVVLPFYYCYGLSLLHTHVKVGGSLVLNNNFMFLGSVINDLIKYKCTGFAGVPSHFQVLLRKSETFKKSEFPHLRYVTQAGGKLPVPFIKEFIETFPQIHFFVMYGQTEATARLSYLPPERLKDKLGSIGKGIPGVILDVVDKDGNSVDTGVDGEIVAKGKNVMLGYFNDLKSTEDTIKNGWLYTGDLAHKDDDGYIYLTARAKEIIKVGGRRVSPKEIEEAILAMPEIVDCTVIGYEDEVLGEALKAIVVKNPEGQSLTSDDIKRHCSTLLAAYKIPGTVEFTDKVDVVATGKKIKK